MKLPTDPHQLAHYRKLMRLTGNHEYALRIATQTRFRPPAPYQTNTTWFANRRSDGFGADRRARRMAMKKAAKAGVSVAGMTYSPQLASEPGGVDGWYSDIHDLKRRIAAKGKDCEELGVKGQRIDRPEPTKYRVADHIVNERVNERVMQEYAGCATDQQRLDLCEKVRQEITPDL